MVVMIEPLVLSSAAAMVSMMRVFQERVVDPQHAAKFASPEPLCRRRADAMVTKIFAVGGRDVTDTTLSSIECLDPLTGEWSVVASMSTARCDHGVGVVDGKLYIVGGRDGTNSLSSVECFDSSTEEWSVVAPMSTPRHMHGVAVVDGKLYAVGGRDGTRLSSVECFDPSMGQWSAVAAMITARGGHGVAVVDGKLYAMGGYDATNTDLSSVE
jgi:N-acetylneuraminic acid mutarotase